MRRVFHEYMEEFFGFRFKNFFFCLSKQNLESGFLWCSSAGSPIPACLFEQQRCFLTYPAVVEHKSATSNRPILFQTAWGSWNWQIFDWFQWIDTSLLSDWPSTTVTLPTECNCVAIRLSQSSEKLSTVNCFIFTWSQFCFCASLPPYWCCLHNWFRDFHEQHLYNYE